MGDTSSTMNTRFIAALFVAAVAVAAAGEMDQYNTDVAFAEATSFVQSYLEAQVFEGKTKDESACEKVADDSIKEITDECKKLQGMVNSAATKNAHCCKDSMGPVRKAVSRYNKSKSDRKQCDRELESLRNSNVSFSGVKFKYLKEGKCGNFFTGGSFRSVHNKVKAKTKRCDIIKGQTKAYKRQWDTAVAQACRGRDKCNARAKTAHNKAFRTATNACQSAKNKKAWTRAKHMKCVLKGQTLSQCRVGSVPKIEARTMTKRKCNCQCHSINNDYNRVANDSVHGVSRTIVGHTPTDVRKSRFMGMYKTYRNFEMEFSIKPHSKRGGWQNILHFTANNHNHGPHGSRIPGIWFYGSSTRMHIRMGHNGNSNDGCDPSDGLALHKWTRVSVVLRGRTLSVDYNGKRVCTSHNYAKRYYGYAHVRLYMADPWYTSAHASIRDFTYGKADYGATGKCDGSVDAPTKPTRVPKSVDSSISGNAKGCKSAAFAGTPTYVGTASYSRNPQDSATQNKLGDQACQAKWPGSYSASYEQIKMFAGKGNFPGKNPTRSYMTPNCCSKDCHKYDRRHKRHCWAPNASLKGAVHNGGYGCWSGTRPNVCVKNSRL